MNYALGKLQFDLFCPALQVNYLKFSRKVFKSFQNVVQNVKDIALYKKQNDSN